MNTLNIFKATMLRKLWKQSQMPTFYRMWCRSSSWTLSADPGLV